MTDRDPFELLAALNPVEGLSERLPGDDAMLAAIVAAPVVPLRRARGRRRRWVTGGAVVVVSAGLAAAAFLRQESPTNPLQLVCYPVAEDPPPALFDAPMGQDPIASCGELWMNGRIAFDGAPPPLTACVLDTGVIGVIPGDQRVCAELGLANWVGALTDDEQNLLAFQEALFDNFAERCVGEADVEARTRDLMDAFDVADWTLLQRGGYSVERPCSGVVAFAEDRLVVIISRRVIPDSVPPSTES